MIKKYNVTVNGKAYQVEVEEIQGAARPDAAAAPVSAPMPKPAAPPPKPAAPAAPPPAALPTGATTVPSPMPGTITAIKVRAGDAIKRGDVLLVLEAMKMENDIMAPGDGVVSAVHVSQGFAVNTGDPLISLN